jgi:hypothetical protein
MYTKLCLKIQARPSTTLSKMLQLKFCRGVLGYGTKNSSRLWSPLVILPEVDYDCLWPFRG